MRSGTGDTEARGLCGKNRPGEGRALSLRVHAVLPVSCANGPGRRYVLWVQGCSRRCPGCFNAGALAPEGGRVVAVEDLLAEVSEVQRLVEGVTVSGGEPLQQAEAVYAFLQGVRERTNLSTLLFTGLSFEELRNHPWGRRLTSCLDLLVAGPYVARLRCMCDLRSSSNQTVHFLTPRYSREDLNGLPRSELVIRPDGSIIATGIDPFVVSGSGSMGLLEAVRPLQD